jgi:pyridoxal phosphate enzyme (YggS family)
MDPLKAAFQGVKNRIVAAEREAQRPEGSVVLIAVSKKHSAEAIRALHALGQRDFAENYVQEALAKQALLQDLDLIWHFIGPIQSNKTAQIAAHFDWVHSVDRLKIAERLSAQRPEGLPPLNVCIQVNISAEATKSGVSLEALPVLVKAIAALPNLRLRGLMAIPAVSIDETTLRAPFALLHSALKSLNCRSLDTLSMGMSEDLEAAILEGATQVRVGTALFGARPKA